jgi:hypothetical protein
MICEGARYAKDCLTNPDLVMGILYAGYVVHVLRRKMMWNMKNLGRKRLGKAM